jgi:molybdopterin molybdotransferase
LGADSVATFLLPSNPISALVIFEVLVRPLIRLALGKRNPHRRTIAARLLSPVTSTAGRRGFLRGQLLRDPDTAEYLVQPLGTSGAHLLASLAEANCLILVDPDITEVPMGEQVAVSFLAQRG